MSAKSLKVAAAQYAPILAEPRENMVLTLERIAEAAAAGADILVLPECCTTGYYFEERSELFALAETVPGPATDLWCKQSADTGMHLVAGVVERCGEELFNTAVVIAPEGKIACYRKIHLWGIERTLYAEGGQPLIVPTSWGNLGVLICYDLWFPELVRAIALAGADLLAVPANWGGNPRMRSPFDAFGLPMGYHMAVTAACTNECPVVVADRIGSEASLHFLGNSSIVSATGEVLAGPLSDTEEGLIVAEIPLHQLLNSPGQSHLESRRPHVYACDPGGGGQVV